jgi:hypothetical protein
METEPQKPESENSNTPTEMSHPVNHQANQEIVKHEPNPETANQEPQTE